MWLKDIDKTKLEEFEDNSTALSFHLNRSGIFDALPEAFFHEMEDDKNATGETMAKDSVRLKQEERQSRLFFSPLENELLFIIFDAFSRSSAVVVSLRVLSMVSASFWSLLMLIFSSDTAFSNSTINS